MTRRERLMRTLRGESVDRPAVCFYEINGLDQDPANADPFNIYSHPSWQPVLELARNWADRIVMRGMPFRNLPPERQAGRFIGQGVEAVPELIQRLKEEAKVL